LEGDLLQNVVRCIRACFAHPVAKDPVEIAFVVAQVDEGGPPPGPRSAPLLRSP
jgi:hypothetical protein